MTITQRTYDHARDFDRVGRFLTATYYDPATPQHGHINWLMSRWEYMHYHPLIEGVDLNTIAIWESGGDIVAVAHPEHPGSPAYFEIHPAHESRLLKYEILAHAEKVICAAGDNPANQKHEGIYLVDGDEEFRKIARAAGYSPTESREPTTRVATGSVADSSPLPAGYRLQSMADDNDLVKMHRLLHRGFDHAGEPPEDGVAERAFMQSALNFRKDLNIVAVAPNGDWASYCGMWYEPAQKIAYVEPVATDPDYRLRGLGKAVVAEGIRRCQALGAEVAYVGATFPIYLSLGFRLVYGSRKWTRRSP
ncbi:MAG: GNAT family N-acetyltransferase [Dehalococcoidia bacterium]|nr:GNAT family N-acetyltransferase [Dehalococcoidia bacterium]